MGYVAVRGGGLAIEESLKLLEYQRAHSGVTLEPDAIRRAFPDAIDQVMGESSLFAPDLAALALKQARGSIEEAVFLLRAFRSTLERPYVSRAVDTSEMRVDRRISAAFKDIPGGQVLGATRDYSHRLIDFDLAHETPEDQRERAAELERHFGIEEGALDEALLAADTPTEGLASEGRYPKVLDYLRSEGILPVCDNDDAEPVDVTMGALEFPCARSARLQTLSRGMTQAVEAFGYAAIRGYGPSHPTVGELRHGMAEVCVDVPGEERCDAEDAYYLGSIPLTEVESVFEVETEEAGVTTLSFEIGYGLVMGGAETKAIAMSVLDHCLDLGDARYPTQDEEFVLYHVDGVEAQGFISHLKLPHYVTFQSKLDTVRTARSHESDAEGSGAAPSDAEAADVEAHAAGFDGGASPDEASAAVDATVDEKER